MAYTKTPVNSTYDTKHVPLVVELASRSTSTSKDCYMLNSYAEIKQNKTTNEQEMAAFKRAGCSSVIATVGASVIRGMYHWYGENRLYVAIGADIYVYNATTYALVTTLVAAFGTTVGDVGFEEFLYDTGVVKILASDGTTLNTIDNANTVVPAVAPPVHYPCPVFIDGYVFLLKVGTADIYNCANGDPLDWADTGAFITAELRPDKAFKIASLNNYLVTFGESSIEYFYDAAIATGSPLGKNDSATKWTGYIGGYAKLGGKIFFVGQTSESGPDVFILEDFKATPVGTEAIRRHLEAYPETLSGAVVSFNGHDFYVLSTSAASYALDLKTLLWAPWSFKATSKFTITWSTPSYTTSTAYRNFFCTSDDQTIYRFDTSLGQDAATDFTWQLVTTSEDFGSYNRKTSYRLTIYSDRTGTDQDVLVQTSDDDYITWSTAQTVNLNQDLPCCYRMGMFRNRAHKLTYTGSQTLRVYKLELDLNIGSS